MALLRCTCIYRTRPAGVEGHSTPFTEITRDPFCPSADRHDREAAAVADVRDEVAD